MTHSQAYRIQIQTDAEHAERQRPQKLITETFGVFWISETFGGQANSLGSFDDFDQALAEGQLRTSHKTKFYIKRTHCQSGDVTLHFYTMRKKSKGQKRYHNYQTRVIHDEYAEHLFDLKMDKSS